jgi:hypothetical protein
VGLTALALALADLVIGFIVFSLAILGIFWYFAFAWIQLSREYAASQMTFGTTSQLDMATALVFVVPVFMTLVAYLGIRATHLPRRVWSSARTGLPLAAPPTGASGGIASAAPRFPALFRR